MIEPSRELLLAEDESSSSETKVKGIESSSGADVEESLKIVAKLSSSETVGTIRLSWVLLLEVELLK